MVGGEGFEPPNGGIKIRCLTSLANPQLIGFNIYNSPNLYNANLCNVGNNHSAIYDNMDVDGANGRNRDNTGSGIGIDTFFCS
jgi:hypothetical protein